MSRKRSYRSPVREARAQQTRRLIRASARRLFESRGFTGTTVQEIADGAGVSVQTVFAVFGSKSAIVGEMLEDIEESAGMEGWVGRMAEEADPRRQLRLFVSMNRALFEPGAPILRAVVAARHDPAVAAIAERGNANRRDGAMRLARAWSRQGALRGGMGTKEAADRLWLLTSAEQFLLAIDGLGWTPRRYERWLGDLLESQLFAPRPEG